MELADLEERLVATIRVLVRAAREGDGEGDGDGDVAALLFVLDEELRELCGLLKNEAGV